MTESLVPFIGLLLGAAVASGLRLYATVAVLGFLGRSGVITLPGGLQVLAHSWVIVVASSLYLVEFVADKVPWVDSLWDAVHTVIRPIGGALIAVATLGQASPTIQGLVALLGGSLAASTHFTKAGTRAVANASPEPFTNWILSLAEDVFVVGLGFVALKYPVVAALVVIVGVVLIVSFAAWIVRAVRRRESVRALLRRDFEPGFDGPEDVPPADIDRIWTAKSVQSGYNHPEYRFTVHVNAPVSGSETGTEREREARALADEIHRALRGELAILETDAPAREQGE